MEIYIKALIAVIIVWYVISYIRWWIKIYRPISKMPGMTRVPILGTTYKIIGVPRESKAHFEKNDLYEICHDPFRII